jgi:hypothetical protein
MHKFIFNTDIIEIKNYYSCFPSSHSAAKATTAFCTQRTQRTSFYKTQLRYAENKRPRFVILLSSAGTTAARCRRQHQGSRPSFQLWGLQRTRGPHCEALLVMHGAGHSWLRTVRFIFSQGGVGEVQIWGDCPNETRMPTDLARGYTG